MKLVFRGELIRGGHQRPKELERLKNECDEVIADSFVLYVEKMSRLRIERFKDVTLVIAPPDLPQTFT